MELREIIARFEEPQKCYGHCDQPSTLRILKENGTLIAGMVCHAGYVSRIIAYSRELDLASFKSFISESLGGSLKLFDEDLRTATRFSWDLGIEGEEEVVKVAYWTQNYRRSKTEAPDRQALFGCANCGKLYVQSINSRSVLCANCRPS